MRLVKFAAVLLVLVVIAGCGGDNSAGDQTPKIRFVSLVSFGDSLSDVGTYKVSRIDTLFHGGKYTINGPNAKIWVELMAAQLQQGAPCAAQTGLNSIIPGIPAAFITNHVGCTAYAQGGARVKEPVGIGNINTFPADPRGALGQLTVPVTTQIQTHLMRNGGTFNGTEIVFVQAGGNDVFFQLRLVGGGLSAADAVAALAAAGSELADAVNASITAKGAKYVTVANLPDISLTPFATGAEFVAPGTKALISAMVQAFNAQLKRGLADNASALYVDAYTVSRDQNAHPAQYDLTNVTTPACDLSNPATNPLASSLICTAANLIPGAVDNYQYADTVHPTPYGYQLLAQLVSLEMAKRGWL